MKRLTALLLAGVLVFGCVGCGNNNAGNAGNSQNTESSQEAGNSEAAGKVEVKDATDLFTKVWNEYTANAAEDVQFPSMGGNIESPVENAPGKFDLSVEFAQETLVSSYCIPAESIAMTDDISTLMHMMMANNFSGAAYHVTDAANVEAFIASIKDATLNNHWMCGFPEKFIAVTVGDNYVLTAYGNGLIIEPFKTAITTAYGDAATIVVEENIGE